jgi:nucleoid-associated protein YgaU
VPLEQMYVKRFGARPLRSAQSDRAVRRLYRWALVLVAALAVMLALSRVAHGGVATATVVVQPGDTLWTIAAERYPSDDTRARIDEIERLNNLSSPVIVVGETLRLPA